MARPSKKSEKSSSSSTRKATRAKKDPTKPKRALSAYVLFAQETRNQVKEENPEAGFGDIGRILGQMWKDMDDKAKKPFKDLADKDKLRAERELAEWKAAQEEQEEEESE